MANEKIKNNYKDIADAIRAKTGENGKMTAEEMPAKIEAIPTGIEPTGTINITTNGDHTVTEYSMAHVEVPNPSTGTKNITSNGDHDVKNYATAHVNVRQPSTVIIGRDGEMGTYLESNALPAICSTDFDAVSNVVTIDCTIDCSDISVDNYTIYSWEEKLSELHILTDDGIVMTLPILVNDLTNIPSVSLIIDFYVSEDGGWSEESTFEATDELQQQLTSLTAADVVGHVIHDGSFDNSNIRVRIQGAS